MKVFASMMFGLNKMCIRFVGSDGKETYVEGEPCNEMVPYWGCKLEDAEEEKLKSWLNREKEFHNTGHVDSDVINP